MSYVFVRTLFSSLYSYFPRTICCFCLATILVSCAIGNPPPGKENVYAPPGKSQSRLDEEIRICADMGSRLPNFSNDGCLVGNFGNTVKHGDGTIVSPQSLMGNSPNYAPP